MTEEENKLPSQEMNSDAESEQQSDFTALGQSQEDNQDSGEASKEEKDEESGQSSDSASSEQDKVDKSSVGYVFKKAKSRIRSLSKKTKKRIGIISGIVLLLLIIWVLFATHVVCFHDWAPATCTEPETCKICGATQGEATGHDWSAATCTMPMTCKICDEHYGTALGHKVEEWTVELDSTCTEEGTQVGICTVCEMEVSEPIAKKEHTPGDWEIVEEATEIVDGTRVQKCTVCGTVVKSEEYSLTPAQIKEQYVKSCQSYAFKDLARNADSLIGKKIVAKGEVVQVLTEGNYYEMRVNITKGSYGYWSDTVYVTYTKDASSPNIIEDDVITFYGEIAGNTSYTSVMGATITLPKIKAKYIDIN